MFKFVITAKMQNGDAWETVRHTRDGLREVMRSIWKDSAVVGFSVEEVRI